MARNNWDENVKQQLIKIVDTHGGEQCKSWTQVARVFYEVTGIYIHNTFDLKKKWEMFTHYTENISDENKIILYITGINQRGNSKAGSMDFYQQTNIKLFVNRYSKYIQTFVLQALKCFNQAFFSVMKQKYKEMRQERFASKISYVSIYYLLKAADISPQYETDYIIFRLKKAAQKFESLLICQAKNFQENTIKRFELFRNIATRREFKSIIFFLDYMNDLKQISINLYPENDIVQHPLLKKRIQDNKKELIYKLIIAECDWNEKYQQYQECIQQILPEEELSLMIKKKNKKDLNQSEINNSLDKYVFVSQASHKVCNKASKQQITKAEKKQITQFRGHYFREGQIRTKGLTTILFDHDVGSQDELEDNEEINKNRELFFQNFQNMQKVYEEVFENFQSLKQMEKNNYKIKHKL